MGPNCWPYCDGVKASLQLGECRFRWSFVSSLRSAASCAGPGHSDQRHGSNGNVAGAVPRGPRAFFFGCVFPLSTVSCASPTACVIERLRAFSGRRLSGNSLIPARRLRQREATRTTKARADIKRARLVRAPKNESPQRRFHGEFYTKAANFADDKPGEAGKKSVITENDRKVQGAERPMFGLRGQRSRVWKPFYLKSLGIATVSVAPEHEADMADEPEMCHA